MTFDTSTVGFAAPSKFGSHVFRVQIPAKRGQPVVIFEDYGFHGQERGIPEGEQRVVLDRSVWAAVADVARREFNGRLKTAKIATGKWRSGENLVDRFLGRELCVLAWAAELADSEQLQVICGKWAALRPEERWWLYGMTVAEAGLPEDSGRGWRQALFLALSDGERAAERKRRPRPVQGELFDLPLFSVAGLEDRNDDSTVT